MKRTIEYIRKSLIEYYSQLEIESFIDIIFNNIYNYSKKDLLLRSNETLTSSEFQKIEAIIKRLQNFEPIQYIFGVADFYNLKFHVNANVLIPRSETEELVHLILNEHKNKPLRVLDIGTGSGCIPITLKKNNPFFEVFTCDISDKALDVAQKNATGLNVDVAFIPFDILSEEEFPETNFDLIVSNPPYVTEKEKYLMQANVLDNEPHLALFVPDNNPLLFYNAITQRAMKILKPNGEIYFEINEAYGNETKALLEEHNFSAIIIKDLNGKDRIVKGTLKE